MRLNEKSERKKREGEEKQKERKEVVYTNRANSYQQKSEEWYRSWITPQRNYIDRNGGTREIDR